MLRKFIPAQIFFLTLALMCSPSPGASDVNYASLVPSYNLSVKIFPDAQKIEVTGTVRLPAVTQSQDFIPALLSDQMREFRVDVVEPASSAGPAGVEAKGKSTGRMFYAIIPPKPFPANEQVVLRFSYTGGEKGGFVFHLGVDGSFAHGSLGAWYPLFDAGEYTGHVGLLSFSVPSRHVVVASGKLLSTPKEMTQGDYRFEVARPAVFSFASAIYTIARRTDKPTLAVYLLQPRPNIDAYLKQSSKVLEYLERQFGNYPNEEFALVEVPTAHAAGFFGASSPGIVFIPSKFIDSPFDYSLHGHEISHQWWGGTIGVKGSKGSYLLSEGMAQLGSLLTVEALEGSVAAQEYRQTGYPSLGKYNFSPCEGKSIPIQSLHGYLMMTSTDGDQKLDSLNGELAHGLAVSKGFLVLDLLSRTVGREKFRKVLADFTRQHAYREVVWEEFLQAVEDGAGRDMKWFYEQWFERTGVPDLSLTWDQKNGRVRGVISQPAPFYQLSIKVQINGHGKKQELVKTVDIRGAQTEFDLEAGFPVRSVILDPNFLVPRWTAEYRAQAEELKRCAAKP